MIECANIKCKQHDNDYIHRCSNWMNMLAEDCGFINAEKPLDTPVQSGDLLFAVLEAIKEIRKSDCGAWLKDCSAVFRCSDGREKRQELSKLLDKLYKVSGF